MTQVVPPDAAPPSKVVVSTPTTLSLNLVVSVLLLTAVAFIPLILFSEIGWGTEVLNALGPYSNIDNQNAEWGAETAATLLLFVLYLFDAEHWVGRVGRGLLLASLSIFGFLIFFAAMISAEESPEWALSAVVLLMPLTSTILRSTLFKKSNELPHVIFRVFAISFAVAATAVLLAWIIWVGVGNQYTDANMQKWSRALRCDMRRAQSQLNGAVALNLSEPNVTALNVTTTTDTCLVAYLLWGCPLITSLGSYLFAGIFYGFGLFIQKHEDNAVELAVKGGMVTLITMLGVAMSFNAYSSVLFHSLVVLMFTTAWVSTVIIVSTIGWKRFLNAARKSSTVAGAKRRLAEYESLKGLVVVMGLLFFVPYLITHMVKQLFRTCLGRIKCLSCCMLPPVPNSRGWLLTEEATELVVELRSWRWVSVLSWATLFAWLGWFFLYFPMLTNIFVAYFIQLLSPLNWGLVSFIFLALGIFMFLNPAFPGPVLYLMGGVLITPLCDKAWNGEVSTRATPVIGPFFWTVFLCFLIKLVSNVLCQKIFGECMGSDPKVRSMLAPNSMPMRTVRYVVSEPGCSLGKVLIFCAFPADWPVAVYYGVLFKMPGGDKMSTISAVLATTPIVILITPFVAMGTLAFYASIWGAFWNTVESLITIFNVAVTSVASLVCLYYIAQAVRDPVKKAVVEAYEEDKDVAAIDAASAARNALVADVTTWDKMPLLVKLLLFVPKLGFIASSYMLFFAKSHMYVDLDITGDYNTVACTTASPECPTPHVKPLGWAGFALILFHLLGDHIFNRWVSNKVGAHSGADKTVPEPPTDPQAAPAAIAPVPVAQQCAA